MLLFKAHRSFPVCVRRCLLWIPELNSIDYVCTEGWISAVWSDITMSLVPLCAFSQEEIIVYMSQYYRIVIQTRFRLGFRVCIKVLKFTGIKVDAYVCCYLKSVVVEYYSNLFVIINRCVQIYSTFKTAFIFCWHHQALLFCSFSSFGQIWMHKIKTCSYFFVF